jgi:phage protein D
MSKSPLISEGDLPTYKILVDGQPIKDFYQVVSIHTEKEINTISTAQIILMDGEVATENFSISESDDFVPGKKIEIQMGYHATDKPIYTGIIMAQQIKVRSSVNRLIAQLTVKCSDEALKLTVAKNNITFKDKKDSDAITSILAKAGIAKTVETTEFQYPKLVQYDCTDWDFILSRAEINGFVVLCNDGKLDIGKPRLDGNSILSLTYGKDVIDFQGELDAQNQLQSVLSKSWDSSQQKVLTGNSIEPNVNPHGNITGKKLSEVLNSGIYEMHTTVPEDASVLKTWANAKLQKSRLAKLRGYVTFSGNADPLPGKIIELNGFGQRMNGKVYISKVLHTFESGIWTTHVGFGLSPKWFSETKQLVSPTAKGLLPGIQGLQTGVVKQLDQDPDGEFRILVTVPMIEEAGDGIWARLAHE